MKTFDTTQVMGLAVAMRDKTRTVLAPGLSRAIALANPPVSDDRAQQLRAELQQLLGVSHDLADLSRLAIKARPPRPLRRTEQPLWR